MSDQMHPMQARQPDQDYFRSVLVMVVGQAFTAAGYELLEEPIQWLSGRYRFHRDLGAGWSAYIAFQVLIYTETAYAARMPNRFQVTLTRSNRPGGKPSPDVRYAQRTLSALVVDDFGVAILPSANHWWTFTDTESLGKALAEAGHLIVGYGIPWLAGDLTPGAALDDERQGNGG